MYWRWMKLFGTLLLCVYAAAIFHQILPHGPAHGNGESCSLCLLLTGVTVLAACATLILAERHQTFLLVPSAEPHSRRVREPFSLRGPPLLPS